MNTTNNSLLPGGLQAPLAASFTHLETNDVFQQAWSLPKWNQDYLQITKGNFQGRLSDISLGPIQLFRETMDKAVDQRGQPWPNSMAFGIPIHIEGDGYWCGDRIEPHSAFFLKPNSELKFKTPLFSDIYVAVIDHELMCNYADTIEEVDIEHLCTVSGAERTSPQLWNALRTSFMRAFEGISNNPAAINDANAVQALREDILQTLFGGLAALDKVKPHGTGQFVHRHIVEKAREYILSRRSNPPSVLEICQELRISRRTLHYAFQKVLNINPVTFLRYLRLHGARHELLTSPPGTLMISEIAAHWGFWHLGMFSSYYKDLFGETPSATARRAISH
nr:hypothetical protein [Gammaproteobacteria bacterium]